MSQVDPTVRTGSHSGHGSGLSFSIQKALPGTLGASPQWLPCPCLCQPVSAHLLLPWFSVPLHLGLPTPLPPHPCSLSPSTRVCPHCDGARCDVFYFLSPPRTRNSMRNKYGEWGPGSFWFNRTFSGFIRQFRLRAIGVPIPGSHTCWASRRRLGPEAAAGLVPS